MGTIVSALRTVLGLRPYRVLGVATFAVFLALYLMTLPSSFTGGRIGLIALRYLDVKLTIVSVIMAALVTLIVTFMVYLLRQGQHASKTSAAGGIAVGVLTPVLCCSPALPIALGFVAGIFPTLMGSFGWRIQGFIATHQMELFLFAVLLLALALYLNAKSVVRGASCAIPRDVPVESS